MAQEITQLWVVGRHSDPHNNPMVWEFMGVFSDRALAVTACTGPHDFIGPAVLNERCPDEATLWPGTEFPGART